MSKRRKSEDWVWLKPNSGFIGESHKRKAEIQPEEDAQYCMLSCGDSACREWKCLLTEECPDCKTRHSLFHVSECQMLDEQWVQ